VRLNSKQYDGSGERPQTSDGQVSFRCGEEGVWVSVLGGRSVGTARYGQMLKVHSIPKLSIFNMLL